LRITPTCHAGEAYARALRGAIGRTLTNAQWFADLDDARAKIDAWRHDYNDVRPHSSLDGRTPSEYERDFNQRLTQRVA
jgi:putative transposase